jgi:monoamine oxidase
LRPASAGQLEPVAYKSWQTDPWAGGTWSVWSPGQPQAFLPALAEAEGRLHFCGEHTALSNRGMEGAMESGERAALEVLAAS